MSLWEKHSRLLALFSIMNVGAVAGISVNMNPPCSKGATLILVRGSETFTKTGAIAATQDIIYYDEILDIYQCGLSNSVCTYYIEKMKTANIIRQCDKGVVIH